jgi:hypothetical protein
MKEGLELAIRIATDYKDNAGGSQSYRLACWHIIQRLEVELAKIQENFDASSL